MTNVQLWILLWQKQMIDKHERAGTLGNRCEAGATMVNGVIVARVLAEEVWQAHEAVYATWETLRPEITGKAARRIGKP
jgi:hypothetical protein